MIEISTIGDLTVCAIYYTPLRWGMARRFREGQKIDPFLQRALDQLELASEED